MCIRDSSQSYYREGKLITPRGYYREKTTDATGIGQEIMINSFGTIEKELKNKNIPPKSCRFQISADH